MKPQDIIREKNHLWIFGYGSLVWKPDFAYKRSKVGFIRGYKRRFWHGDDFYRGDKERPGRVATLVEDQEACTWGVAYEVSDSQIEESLQYLNMREAVLGGYTTEMVEFIPKEKGQGAMLALVYIATSDNPAYLGPASDKEIAAQIAVCRGNTGHNIEYLVRLAEFMRLYCPEVEDEHLFSIEAALLNIFHDRGGIKPLDQMSLLVGAS
ncbi:glutathione-specific gamma-glutamylcyclotransferase 1-like [Epinephelus fuscoguttatus]|uniref:glutathione-specific gamma-glutamylcyclotransferase 1-like n=1 Tax=Epinephelus fuscoguttatus TaxID=293821 RepID=UPI0020D19C3E|nr:glutathione-specific gamma-glutamylcyclotransferase 1-like [Epinephelus fuscoguttatus]